MYKDLASKLFSKGKKSRFVERDYKAKRLLAVSKQDAKLLERIDYKIKEKTVTLFAMSLEACDLLDLPKDRFYDLYFRGTHTNKANLLKGMHAEGMMSIIKFRGYTLDIIKNTKDECTIEFSLDDGELCRHTFTIEDARNTPWIMQEMENGGEDGSLWNTMPKEMLLHEAVKFIAKIMYRRLFKVKSQTILNDFGLSSNRDLAEEIFDEGIYDIESVDYTYLDTFQSLEVHGDKEALGEFLTNLRTKCVNRICASLDVCDAVGLPKEDFYDVAKYDIYNQSDFCSNIRACYAVDVLRHFGHLVRPENLSSRSAMIRYESPHGEEVEHVSLESLCNTRAKIKASLEDPESVWRNHTMLMLFYEVLNKALKKCFAKVRVRNTRTNKGDAQVRFFAEIKKYRLEGTPTLTENDDEQQDEQEEQEKQDKQEEQSEDEQPPVRKELIIPQSYTDFVIKRKTMR